MIAGIIVLSFLGQKKKKKNFIKPFVYIEPMGVVPSPQCDQYRVVSITSHHKALVNWVRIIRKPHTNNGSPRTVQWFSVLVSFKTSDISNWTALLQLKKKYLKWEWWGSLHQCIYILFSLAGLSLKPDEAIMYNLRAQVRGKMGLIAEAMSDYNQALDLEECSTAMWIQTCGLCSRLSTFSSWSWNIFVV